MTDILKKVDIVEEAEKLVSPILEEGLSSFEATVVFEVPESRREELHDVIAEMREIVSFWWDEDGNNSY